MQKARSKVFHILNSKLFEILIIILIIINTISVILETFSLPDGLSKALSVFETVSVIIFSVEYIGRIWTADMLLPNLTPFRARARYARSFMAVIDLLAILPFYIPMLIPIDLRALRMLRLVRLVRLFKINRYSSALSTIAEVFRRKAPQLISSIGVVSVLMLVASLIMYNVEHEAQPDNFSNVFQALWWSVATLTTVGYGDIYPVTVAGKLLSTVIAVLGIGMVAVPTGIISAGFAEAVGNSEQDDEKCYCPYCGHKIK